ncbi:11907_t:CDS:1 [Ambispora gerdemannii]|uniref:11907_t:CDS:1 n=1 Tax=Ambispora gerdemannii TaxID=144530 RepID=A0A9N9AP48_9GLOM|nr:11907_t:CDS:1 [Ambispora gerdemannii]
MTKRINLFFILALAFAFISTSINGAFIVKRDPYVKNGIAKFNNFGTCHIDGYVSFNQFEDDYVRITGQFWSGFPSLDTKSYRFQIWTTQSTGGILETKLKPHFYVAGGATSWFELYNSDITLDDIGFPGAENVASLWLRIYHNADLLCGSQIKIT